MGQLLGLPPELLWLITEHLYHDKAALRAFSLVSRALLQPSQSQLFKYISIRLRQIESDGSLRKAGGVRERISLDSGATQVLSYTRTLSLSTLEHFALPQQLDDIFDYLIAFKNIKKLRIPLFATHYVRHPLTPLAHYFGHFQPTLRSLHLETWLTNPWDLITFIASFPLLEDVTIQPVDSYNLPTLQENKPEGFKPAALLPFRGSLRLDRFYQENTFILELVKSRVRYHTFSFRNVTVWTGVQELIVACAPTLRVLDFFSLTSLPIAYWDSSLNLTACIGLTEIYLSLISLETSSLGMEPHLTLLSTISSLRLRRITLTINVEPFFRGGVLDPMVLAHKGWGAVEDVFLQLAARSQDVINVAMRLLVIKRSGSNLVLKALDYERFMSRFKKVGRVEFRFF